jgi:hypothetical protein
MKWSQRSNHIIASGSPLTGSTRATHQLLLSKDAIIKEIVIERENTELEAQRLRHGMKSEVDMVVWAHHEQHLESDRHQRELKALYIQELETKASRRESDTLALRLSRDETMT